MRLIPRPKTCEMMGAVFTLPHDIKIVLDKGVKSIAAKQIKEEVGMYAGLDASVLCGQAREGDIALKMDASLAAQAYTLKIDQIGITLCGGSESGLLHGAQTLRQIIRQSGALLPALTITDAPNFVHRGYYFDVSRGRVPTLATLKNMVDELCFYKINEFQLYVEHTYLFRDLSEAWYGTTPLEAEEIMNLDDYCFERGIELVPSLSTFGHMYEILKTKSFEHLCEMEDPTSYTPFIGRMQHHTINAADPRSIDLVTRMIGEFMPLFRSRHFNICCDETFDLGKGRGAQALKALGEKAFYTGFVKKLCEYVVENGAVPMMWGDIVQHFPDAMGDMPKETVFLNWGYAPNQREEDTRIFAQAGVKQYVCPGVSSWNEWLPKLRSSYENIARMCRYGRKHGAIGVLNTDWGDFGHISDPAFSLPGMIYGAAFSWGDEVSFETINADISSLAYLDQSGKIVSALALYEDAVLYSWVSVVEHDEKDIPLKLFTQDELAQKQVQIKEAKTQVLMAVSHMDSAKRSIAQRWLIALEAISLWNRICARVARNEKDAALAGELENWFYLYQASWRKTAKQGDLILIENVVGRYAARLR